MKQLFSLLCILAAGTFLLPACSDDDEPGSGITVTSFEPNNGFSGETIKITGTGFSADPSKNEVIFHNGHHAAVLSASSTELTVEIPQGAKAGVLTLSVNGGTRMTSPEQVLVHQVPAIEDVRSLATPEEEVVMGGSNYITGVVTSRLDNMPANEFFFQDASAGILVELENGHEFAQGTALRIRISDATLTADGLVKISDVTSADIENFGTGNLPAPAEVTISELLAGDHQGERIVLKAVSYDEAGAEPKAHFDGLTPIRNDKDEMINGWVSENSGLKQFEIPEGTGDVIGIATYDADSEKSVILLGASTDVIW